MEDDNCKNIETIDENIEEEEPAIEELPVEEPTIEIPTEEVKPTPKKRAGRPSGSKDKVPRPKRKTTAVVKEEPLYVESTIESIQEMPRALEGSLPIPPPTESEKAALMFHLLTQHAKGRKSAKQELWRSWFQ